ncbi:NAD-dependent succinate-semialdehyde dehydrogenase [Sphingomonas soli]|uniref:NAD-dependent succinate-semialdehyde dehydrogenase n=1 Tax=Sphingomonas soli TaxID=266127 RepID=UPI00082F72D7|nr:NAD-dependent succinate-semialdehyde dehydrogenase [Sphingomonas soli]
MAPRDNIVELPPQASRIGGAWVTGSAWIDVNDPATGAIIGRVPNLGAEETERAVTAATGAMPAWAARTAAERADILRAWHALVLSKRTWLARLLTLEQGKPIVEAEAEIDYAAAYILWFAEEARRVYGEIIPAPTGDTRILVLRQPVGVVGAITPWNFPAAMITRKLAPAVAAGCGVVLKPAIETPFTAIALIDLAEQAGIPAGLLNLVTGDAEPIGAVLTTDPRVRKISFTGSTAVGARLFAQSASTMKRLGLELGGNAPFVVFEDADLDAAVTGAIQAKFRNAGQTCVCADRFYIQQSIYPAFIERFAAAMAHLRSGSGFAPGVTIGPVIHERALTRLEKLIEEAMQSGARLLCGGTRSKGAGTFLEPTLLCDVDHSMRIVSDEVFGPIAAVMPFADEAEVIERCNASEAGLAAYFYARDHARIWRVAEAIEAGMIGVNTGRISTEVAPFGGVKSSGIGREGSRHGIEAFCELKYVCLDIGSGEKAA